MLKAVAILFFFLFSTGGIMGCMNEKSKTAMIDVSAIISSGQHAQDAANYLKQAQEIYQYNLNIIEKNLNAYTNKDQARAYLIEAARQLQTQLNNSKLLTTQALLNGLNTVLDGQKKAYDLIIKKDGIIYIQEGDGDAASKFSAMPEDITMKVQAIYAKTAVSFPPLPKRIESPNLPADLGEGVPFPPKTEPAAEGEKSQDEKTQEKK